MCIRDRKCVVAEIGGKPAHEVTRRDVISLLDKLNKRGAMAVSYTHLRAHETVLDLVCRLLLEKKKKR